MFNVEEHIIEYVEFKALPNVTDKQVFEALKETDAVLSNIEGFQRRILAKSDQIFVEVVFWDNQDKASKGLEIFKNDARSAKLFGLIDAESVSIRYSSVVK